MSRLDAQLQLSASQALTSTSVGTNVIDLSLDRNIGTGRPMALGIIVEVAADQGTGDESYTFELEYAPNAAQTGARQLISRRVFEATPTAPSQNADLLVAGAVILMPIAPGVLDESEQFLGVRYGLGGTTPSITVSAFVAEQNDFDVSRILYPIGYTIS
jgi:cell wall-associated NlpC family hydrolase